MLLLHCILTLPVPCRSFLFHWWVKAWKKCSHLRRTSISGVLLTHQSQTWYRKLCWEIRMFFFYTFDRNCVDITIFTNTTELLIKKNDGISQRSGVMRFIMCWNNAGADVQESMFSVCLLIEHLQKSLTYMYLDYVCVFSRKSHGHVVDFFLKRL